MVRMKGEVWSCVRANWGLQSGRGPCTRNRTQISSEIQDANTKMPGVGQRGATWRSCCDM